MPLGPINDLLTDPPEGGYVVALIRALPVAEEDQESLVTLWRAITRFGQDEIIAAYGDVPDQIRDDLTPILLDLFGSENPATGDSYPWGGGGNNN